MKILIRRVLCAFLAAISFWSGTVLWDRQQLNNGLVGVWVYAASDTEEARTLAKDVQLAVEEYLEKELPAGSVENAAAWLEEKMEFVQILVRELVSAGRTGWGSRVVLLREDMSGGCGLSGPVPAGNYQTVKIILGNGGGTVFRSIVSGNSRQPGAVWTGEEKNRLLNAAEKVDYGMRFLILDLLGRLEKMLADG